MSRLSDGEPSRPLEVSRLLIPEPPLLVLPSLAMTVGLNEAIFLQQLHYWLLQSGKDRDGRRWIYNTYEEWHAQLPFWSVMTIRRIVGALEDKGVVISTTAYNQHKVDRTKWYSLDYAALDGLLETPDHVINLNSPSDQGEQLQPIKMNKSEPETTDRDIETGEVEASRFREDHTKNNGTYDPARAELVDYVESYAREFRDTAPLSSSVTRTVNLYRRSRRDVSTFVGLMEQARAVTKERTRAIRSGEGGRKQMMGYWFSVLEDLVGQTETRIS